MPRFCLSVVALQKNLAMLKNFWYLFLLAIAFACASPDGPNSTEGESDVKALKKEVIAIHDSAMAKMNVMAQLQAGLKKKWPSSADSVLYRKAYQDLQKSHEDMMDWMHDFNLDENASEEANHSYLRQEKKKIGAINSAMDRNITESESLLGPAVLNPDVVDTVDQVGHHQH